MKALIPYPNSQGGEPTHSQNVQTAFLAGGGANSDIYEMPTTSFNQAVIDYAKANNYDAIIYSYDSEESSKSLVEANPDVMVFIPSYQYQGSLMQTVLTDHIPSASVGDTREFGDITQIVDSNSNGFICGQLFYIAAQRNCTLVEARICANATKDENSIIDVAVAIAYTGEIKLTVGNISAVRKIKDNAEVLLERIIDAAEYEIKIKGIEANIITTDLVNNYTLTKHANYEFSYRGKNGNIYSDWSNSDIIKYNKADFLGSKK